MQNQMFNDGVVRIYHIENSAPPGAKPVEAPMLKARLRYAERTVGIQRHYTALQVNSVIRYLLRVPLRREVSVQDIAVPNDGNQYRISLVQYPENIVPPVMDLTLEDTTAKYDLNQHDDCNTLVGGRFKPWEKSHNTVDGNTTGGC